MLRPIPAVGLASAEINALDFTINALRKDNPIFQPSSPSTTPFVENAAFLQDIIHNLYRLTDLIDNSELKELYDEKSAKSAKAAKKLSEAALQLLKHAELVKELTASFIDAVIAAQEKGKFGDPRWPTAREALLNGVWKKPHLTAVKKRCRALRRDIETSLLLAMRQYLDQSIETGLALFSGDEGVHTKHWEKWQNQTLDMIHSNDWKSNKKKDVEEFSKQVDALIQAEKETFFRATIFDRLWFEEMDKRMNSISAPVDGSFEWVFGDASRQVGGLLEWFTNTRGEEIYWLTGKPGSGKMTLMKHLFRNPRLFPHLEAWSGQLPGITSGFFLWNSGTELQKSSVGLPRAIIYETLQDLIFGPLEEDRIIVQNLFSDRWNAFLSYAGGLHKFDFPELKAAFEGLVSDANKKFFFMIDGLDETDDYPKDLMDLVFSTARRDNVKFLLSARSSPAFQSAFENKPRLMLEEHIKDDIQNYLTTTFNMEPKLQALRGKMDGDEESTIVSTLAEKSSGVFLWAQLATTFLFEDLEPDSDFLILKDRADALPYILDDLLAHILSKLAPEDVEALSKLHNLLSYQNTCPAILPFSFAYTAETPATLAADVRPLTAVEISKRVEDMQALTRQRCKGLLSIFDTTPPDQHASFESLRVTYTHRAIHDYFLAYPGLLKTNLNNNKSEENTWNPAQQWANSHLWLLKTLSPPTARRSSSGNTNSKASALHVWTPLSSALESSLELHTATNKFPLTYIDAALTTAVFLALRSETGHDLPQYSFSSSSSSHTPSTTPTPSTSTTPTTLTAPLDLAVLLNLTAYIALKAKTTDRREIRHALDYSRGMRKRMGVGGEKVWLSGRERERLRKEFEKGRQDGEALLEYYAKAVKFGVSKPEIEAPEWV
ncbi:hypothetical protein ACET3X_008080 [Alternaria dauci]|uniref:Nephrocystin 3-like N-terminal domain-containing protein n=1 Tax=Alternaria dauci TaxID=48095 RepID=A0ABR3U9A6_9PLEO